MNVEVNEVDNGYTIHMYRSLISKDLVYKTDEKEKMIADVIRFVNTQNFPDEEDVTDE